MQMYDLREKLLNDLILFLTLCPNGLGLTEVAIVLQMLPSKLDENERKDKIEHYCTIMNDLAYSQTLDDSNSESAGDMASS